LLQSPYAEITMLVNFCSFGLAVTEQSYAALPAFSSQAVDGFAVFWVYFAPCTETTESSDVMAKDAKVFRFSQKMLHSNLSIQRHSGSRKI
jgi:hypothetical protein